MGTDDEAFERLALPFTLLPNPLRELLHLSDAFKFRGFCFDEPELARKRVYNIGERGPELLGALIDSVKMKSRVLRSDTQDVLLERVVAELI